VPSPAWGRISEQRLARPAPTWRDRVCKDGFVGSGNVPRNFSTSSTGNALRLFRQPSWGAGTASFPQAELSRSQSSDTVSLTVAERFRRFAGWRQWEPFHLGQRAPNLIDGVSGLGPKKAKGLARRFTPSRNDFKPSA
jgi:hypothetical protein